MVQTPPQIFDRSVWQHNRDRAAAGYAKTAFLKELACVRLVERLELVRRDFTDVLDLGCHGGQMGAALPARSSEEPLKLTQTDPSAAFIKQAQAANPSAQHNFVMSDDVLPVAPASCDAVLSALFLHWMNDLPGMLSQIRLALRPDGLLLANLLGGRSLTELRGCFAEAETEICGGISPRCMPMADIRELGSLLQRVGFALPVADSELLTVTYPDMFRLMADIRAMGGQNCLIGRISHFTPRAVFMRAATLYQQKFTDSAGQIKVTVELITLTGWAPDISQPQPLRPGSAANRLAEALGASETKLKDS
jgi:SAM-dependent methyltransferase